uniref:Mab-21 domain containing 2 n=1 Tax=Cyprinus carpio TaxID=7962 RepID=A0A8C1Q7N8_CYPCA
MSSKEKKSASVCSCGCLRCASQYSACAPLLRFHRVLLANMAAPALSSRAGSAGSTVAPHSPELDFRSGTRIEELNRLIAEFSKHEQREYDDQRALEIHTAKDFIFSMLGEEELCSDTKQHMHAMHLKGKCAFAHLVRFCASLIIRALQAWYACMRLAEMHFFSWTSLRANDKHDGCIALDLLNPRDAALRLLLNLCFSPTLVADWFYESISMVLAEIQKKPQRGVPRVEKVERNATVISIILGVGGSRMLYDVVPVVSFKGWPAVAQSWLMENHFWDGKITEEEVISGFYLLPACSSTGQKENEWRLSFARSEVQLKKCISASLMQAYQACKALIIKLLSRPKAISPYHLRSLMLWACDRLPHTYLAQEDYAAHFLLGLIDDLQHCLVNKTCPNYFIPQCNMLEHLSDDAAMLHARKLSSVRSDPAEHLRSAIEHAKAASRLTHELQWRGGSSNLSSPLSDTGADQQPDDRLAKKLQQLVTENPGKSISVFINPDDVTRPHFRIDDKFF